MDELALNKTNHHDYQYSVVVLLFESPSIPVRAQNACAMAEKKNKNPSERKKISV